MKRCEIGYLGQPGKRKSSSYLATLDAGDKVRYVDGITDDRQQYGDKIRIDFHAEDRKEGKNDHNIVY